MFDKARYSPIGPIAILEHLYNADALGNYLVLLAHDVLEHPQRYIGLVGEMRAKTSASRPFIIMDNSLIERGEALAAELVVEAANYVEADCIALPDVLGDFVGTQKLVMAASSLVIGSGYPLMKVPQGSNAEEQIRCVEWMREYLPPVTNGDLDMWAVPRWITNELGSRIPLIQYLNQTIPNPTIHLFGMSNDIADDMRCTTLPNVIGIDSANPVVLGRANIDLSLLWAGYAHIDRGDYMVSSILNEMAIQNVRYVHACVG